MADTTNKLSGDQKTTLWSGIFGTTSSLVGLGTQALSNQAETIKANAAKDLLALNNQGNLTAAQFALESTKIQTERDAKLAVIKTAQRKQSYLAIGAIVGGLSVVAIIILLIVRKPR